MYIVYCIDGYIINTVSLKNMSLIKAKKVFFVFSKIHHFRGCGYLKFIRWSQIYLYVFDNVIIYSYFDIFLLKKNFETRIFEYGALFPKFFFLKIFEILIPWYCV